jgi:chemotaxis protein histidine kinase CheA
MDVPGSKEAEGPDDGGKAGRRLKKTMKDRLRDAYQTIKEMLTWADYDEEEPPTMLERMKEAPAGLLLKSVGGEPWITTWSSNAFVDRDDEMFSTEGLERYVQAAEKKDDRGRFNFWHVPGTDFATKKWQGVIGRFLVEAGPFDDTPRGKAAKEFFTQYPDGHPDVAPEGWGCSVEYRYLPEQKKERVYEDFWVTRTSVLPRLAAANTRTRGGVTMALTEQQRKALTEIFPDEAESLIAETEAKTKELEEAGVEFKALSPQKAAAALRKLAGDTEDESLKGKLEELAKAMWEEKPEDEDEEDMDEEKEVQEKQAEIDVEALAAEMVKHFDVQLAPLQELQEQAEKQAAEIAELRAALKQKEAAEEKRRDAELPRMVLSLEKRASQAEETVLAEDDPLMKSKPAEPTKTPVDGSGAQHFFPKK